MKTNSSNVLPDFGLAIWQLKRFYEAFLQVKTAGILLNYTAINPPNRQA